MTAHLTDETSALPADEPLLVALPRGGARSHAARSARGPTSFLGLRSLDGTLLESNRNQLITVDLAWAPVRRADRPTALICSVVDLSRPRQTRDPIGPTQ